MKLLVYGADQNVVCSHICHSLALSTSQLTQLSIYNRFSDQAVRYLSSVKIILLVFAAAVELGFSIKQSF